MPNFKPSIALEEHLLAGNPISQYEALFLLGVQSLRAEIGRLKRKGFVVESQRVPLAKVLRRLNEYMECRPPQNLPTREIIVTEYWLSR